MRSLMDEVKRLTQKVESLDNEIERRTEDLKNRLEQRVMNTDMRTDKLDKNMDHTIRFLIDLGRKVDDVHTKVCPPEGR
jgi:phage-related minor tail protein